MQCPLEGFPALSRHGAARLTRLGSWTGPVLDSIPEECKQDEHGVLAAGGKSIRHSVLGNSPLDQALLLHLPKPAGEDPRGQPGVVPEELAEPVELQERHVSQEEQGPLPPQPLHALPDRVRLVREKRVDPAFLRNRRPGRSSHYPSSP